MTYLPRFRVRWLDGVERVIAARTQHAALDLAERLSTVRVAGAIPIPDPHETRNSLTSPSSHSTVESV